MDDNENSESAFVLSESEDECESVIVSSTSCSNTQSQRNSERGGDGDVWAPKSKRKRTDNRRRIRKILSPEQLDAETLSAQKEEQERLRRLELQKSLNVFGGVPAHQTRSTPSLSVSPGDGDTGQNGSAVLVNVLNKISDPVIVIDDSEDESDIQVGTRETEISSSVIEISDSGSDSELDGGEVNDGEPENSGSHTNDDVNQPNADGRVLVNVNHPPTEPDIFLSAYLSKWVKPHQIGGIRFLYDNLVESLSRFDVSPGFGCILAHSMGLGKTLQLICFINIFLTYTKAKKVLCIVPMNTIQNWWSEFNMWLPERSADSTKQSTEDAEGEQIDGEDGSSRLRKFKVFLLSENLRTTVARSALITEWHQKGGVLLMGYEMYRILAMYAPSLVNNSKLTSSKRKKPASSSTEVIDLDEEEKNMELLMDVQKALCRPGPDLVVCDEGHRIKNNQANISQALKKILTRRRVVLTGYPLQNNLLEYWCMVDFVRPNFLGTRHEFSNMFERPITNGQCVDSTASDIKLMRFRAHVLHSLLEGFVQRRSESVLTKTLPEKEEHVIPVGMSSIQISLYKAFVSSVKSYLGYVNPITAFAMCIKIWNHPDILKSYLNSKKEGGRNYSPLTVDDPDLDIGVSVGKKTKETRSEGSSRTTSQGPTLVPPDPKSNMGNNTDWVGKLLDDYESGVLQNGSKMVVLTEIIEKAVSLGDKILVFSQSLSTLSMIEDFLRQRVMPPLPSQIMFQPVHWERNKNYYRLDGGTSSQERDKLIRAFNSKSNQSVFVFLMSTRACSLGVNLIGANRVVIFDASWNPCHDAQAVCRVYRYGQTKKCYIYRLVSSGTFEKQMYERQVTKEGVSDRVIDELNPTANLTKHEVMHLFNEPESDTKESIKDAALSVDKFSDPVLNHVCEVAGKLISKLPFKHKTQTSQKSRNVLTKAEKREAKKGYERDKRAINNSTSRYIPVPFSSSMPIREPVRPQAIKRPIGHVRPIQNVQASPSPCVRTPLVSLGAPLRPPIPPLLGNMPSMAYLMSLSCPPLPHARYYQPGELRPFPPFPANHSSTAAGGVMGRVTSRSPIVVNLLTSHEKDDASKPPESNAGMDKPDESDFTDAQSKSSSDVESPDLAISMTPRQSSAPAVLQLVSTVSANRGSQCQSSSSVESDKRLVDFSVSDGIIMTDENASHSQSSDAVEPSKNLVAADSPSENVATPIESSDD